MNPVIGTLREHAWQRPSAAALVDDGRALSFGDLAHTIGDFGRLFQSYGQQVIGLMADNSIEWVIADLAALASGKTLVPVPPWFTGTQIAHLVQSGGLGALLVDRTAAAVVPQDLPGVSRRLTFGPFGLIEFGNGGDKRDATLPIAKITFTSGSTGRPKGVCLSADTIAAVSLRLRDTLESLSVERHLCALPLATLLENIAGVYVPLMLGSTVCLPSLGRLGLYGSSRLDAGRFANTVLEGAAESLILQPELLRALTVAYGDPALVSDRLRFVAVGGARIADADLAAANNAGIPAYQGYGLSECASVVAINRPGDSRAGSVGRPLPGLSVEILEDGEIVVGNQAMIGYVDGEHTDGTIATGDLGHVDDDGFLYVTGRKKNVFITSFGRNVSPEWPEAELLHEAAVSQACIFGEGRSINSAVLVPSSPGISATELDEAVENANSKLPDYARVGNWIRADEPFTTTNGLLTTTGKVRRDVIAARYPQVNSPLNEPCRQTNNNPKGITHGFF